MQTLSQIRGALSEAGLAPSRQYGQNFLIDLNLMGKLLELAEIDPGATVLEVGSGTGSLTEELLGRCRRVVAVEIDRGLHAYLERRLGGGEKLVLLHGDALRGKHNLSSRMLEALGGRAQLVSNLPYSIATPLVIQCLLHSWRSSAGVTGKAACRFDRLTFTVQREVAQRLSAGPGNKDYGAVSVLTGLLGRITAGPNVPAEAFWPRPAVISKIIRIDFDPRAAAAVRDADLLADVLHVLFNHRRKQIGAIIRRRFAGLEAERFTEAVAAAGIDPAVRCEAVSGEQFRLMANTLAAY